MRRARKKERTKATTSAASPTRIWVFWIWRNGASSRSRLRSATAAPTSWSERGPDRQHVREVGLSADLERERADRLALPQDGLDEVVAPLDRRHRRGAERTHRRGGERRLRGLRRALPASARKTTCVFSSCSRLRATSSLIWNAAAITPDEVRAALEDRRGDDVVELAAREPDPLGLLALERAGDRRHAREVGRVGQRPVGAGERRRPAGRSRSGSPRARSTPAPASACRRPSRDRAGPSRGRASTSSRSCRRC